MVLVINLSMKKNSLSIKIWKYLMLFSVLILLFLWLFQIGFLNTYYRKAKVKDIKQVANIIKNNQNYINLQKIIDNAAYNKGVCVEIINSNNDLIYSSDVMNRGCVTDKDNLSYKDLFINSEKNSHTFQLVNPRFDNETLIYAIKLDNNLYAFVNTSLDPIDSTVLILKNQFIYVTLLVLILAVGVSYFISKNISKPIVKVTKEAKKLVHGEFNVEFDPNEDIEEINELVNTLNYTKEELKKTDEYRRDLMANVSHDLKTPLTMIKAYAEMTSDLNINNKNKIRQDMSVISEEVDRLTVLVNDILDLSKMQSNMNELNIEEFDLIKLINNILTRYEIFVEKEKYKFDFICDRKKIIISADKKMLEQVIYNLINNAINYTGDDKLVTIKVHEENNDILVQIIDTGKGIDDEEIKYIWDKYYKNKKHHKRNVVGTGLGLSIVKNILDLHKFKYGVSSIKNKGTTFYFKIKK